jgi:hypothetical protein
MALAGLSVKKRQPLLVGRCRPLLDRLGDVAGVVFVGAGKSRIQPGAEHFRSRVRADNEAVSFDRPAGLEAADLLDAVGGHGTTLQKRRALRLPSFERQRRMADC